MKIKVRRMARVPVVVGVLVIASATPAFAYWSAAGSGTGKATVATVQPFTISQAEVTELAPGIPQALSGTIANPNAFDVTVTAGSLTVDEVTVDPEHSACAIGENFVVAPPHVGATVVPKKGAVPFEDGSILLRDLPGVDQEACQGAVVTISYRIT